MVRFSPLTLLLLAFATQAEALDYPRYCNGQLKSQEMAPFTPFYPNGQKTLDPQAPYARFYPNGQIIQDVQAPFTLFYPNGQRVRDTLAPYGTYYPNGQLVRDTMAPYSVYYPNGQKTFDGLNCRYQDGSVLTPCPQTVRVAVDAGGTMRLKFKLSLNAGAFEDAVLELIEGNKYKTYIDLEFANGDVKVSAIDAECR